MLNSMVLTLRDLLMTKKVKDLIGVNIEDANDLTIAENYLDTTVFTS